MIGNGAELADSAGFFSTGLEHLKNKNLSLILFRICQWDKCFLRVVKNSFTACVLNKARSCSKDEKEGSSENYEVPIPIPEQALPVAYLCGSVS